ncbi:hypothetical protein [Hymenobacter volaticus]|uniref:Uncharacterized protein n=1 Tax=Hymenobacter volaticus TaxID=2932254 RepID=A0ABY4GE77_9BACT|nr:hypothetical protein [Hymenobacter volaticus]UOQ69152.1 hypothetical protein MUN86_25900 [Hymenobacter volaticus]
MIRYLLRKRSIRFHLVLLAIGLIGCRQAEPDEMSVTHPLRPYWISADSLVHLTIDSTAFTFKFKLEEHVEVEPYRLLANNRLVLGEDTVELHFNRKGELSIEPLSRAERAAKDSRLIYIVRFVETSK